MTDESADTVLVDVIRRDLASAADADAAPRMQAYMKSAMPYLGIRVPQVRAIVRMAAGEHPPDSPAALRATVFRLWRDATYREERYAATELTNTPAAQLLRSPALVPMYEELIVTGAWWDHVDEVSHRIGELLVGWPGELAPTIRRWSASDDLWLRRSSVICQVGLGRATDPALLGDAIQAAAPSAEFFLRKAIGWALRDYARHDPDWVRAFVAAHAEDLSPLSRREALKHL
jgi:3-methyladenine DNA glycosylase AlkD